MSDDKGFKIRATVKILSAEGILIDEQEIHKGDESDVEFVGRMGIVYASLLCRHGVRESINDVLGPPGGK